MTTFTPNLALPKPDLTDTANVPRDIGALADKLDNSPHGKTVLTAQQVLDVGLTGQIRAGRQLTVADFTAMGLMQPVGLWNLSDLSNLGTGGALVNKNGTTFVSGINGAASTAAQFDGPISGKALYIVDTGATDPFRIRTGSWGCWFRSAKLATAGGLITKDTATAGQRGYLLYAGTTLTVESSPDGTATTTIAGVSTVADDRWHFGVATNDGTTLRLYVDAVLEATAPTSPIFPGSGPLNIGALRADGSTAATSPNYGRVDEAFVTPDILTDDQIRLLYCAKIPHGYSVTPSRITLNVRRQRRGGAFVVGDFPSQPVRLHNFTAAALTDQGSGGVALTNNNPTLILPVAGADGDGETPNTSGNAYSFSGAHTGLSATDTGLPSGTNARSYGCWFKTTTAATVVFMGWGTATANDIRLIVFNGQLRCDNGADQVLCGFVADGNWHFVAVVEDNAAGDGVKRKMYVDGRLVGGSTVLNSITLAGANRFRVGAQADGTVPFTGQVDGAFVHNVALTMEQIAALYAKGTQSLGVSPKNPGDHVEAMDGSNVLATFDTLDSTAQVDLGVAA